MAAYLETIKKIEKIIGEKLVPIDLNRIQLLENAYLVDESEGVIGLNLDKSKLSDISFLKDLKNLKELYSSNNHLTDLSPLKDLKNMELLDLRNNHMSQLPADIGEWESPMEIKWEYDFGNYLNDLGVILHFKDFKLKETHVLEPEWATTAVYKIINSKDIAAMNGLLKLELLEDVLKKKTSQDYDYPPGKHKYIIDLMQKFELCYEIDGGTILIPDLLELQQPVFEFDYETALKFRVEYDFLPRSIMPRFIVKMHRDIKNRFQWRTGVVLADETFQATAVVICDDEAKTIFIYVQGSQKRDYFAIILKNLRDIHRSFEKLDLVEKVPMPGESQVTTSYEHLLTLENMGITEFVPDGSKKKYNVKELLGTIYTEKTTEAEILQILKKLQDKFDTEETLLKKADDFFMFQPNIMGIGVNVNKLPQLVKKLFTRKPG